MRTRQIVWNSKSGWTAAPADMGEPSLDRLAAGAADAARQARSGLNAGDTRERFSILVSSIGRRLLMGQRTADEAEAVGQELGADTSRLGFYSYGEISPHAESGICELQTMMVTTLAEVA